MSKRANHTTATQRLKQDYIRLKRDPVPYITSEPAPANILEWHYVVKGPENSLYEGGYYHGRLVFPREFPFKPPSIYMNTPNGRFKCNYRLCLSISDYHPDTWNPAWSVSTILTGLLSFMLEKSPTLGSIETSDHTKRQLAVSSGEFNLKNKTFCELFPEIVQEIQESQEKRARELEQSSQRAGPFSRATSQGGNQNDGNPGGFNNTLMNVVVIVGFALFAYTVKQVLKGLIE